MKKKQRQKSTHKMNVVDRVVSYFSPVSGAKRMMARDSIAAYGGAYKTARRGRTQSENFAASDGSANADILPDLGVIRRQSRELARNQPLAAGALKTVRTNVIGTGINVQSRLDRDILKLSEEQVQDWQRKAEREFKLWSKECDISRSQVFKQLQTLVFGNSCLSGDVFVVRRYKKYAGDTYGLKLQVIEADRVSNPDREMDNAKIAGGVEVNTYGAALAYHVTNIHPGDYHVDKPLKWTRLPAFDADGNRLVLHLFNKDRPDQVRGVPYLAPVIELFKQLERYTDAEIQAAVISSFFTVFVRSELGDVDLEPASHDDDSLNGTKLGTGMIVKLADGEDVTIADPSRPNPNFGPFVSAVLRQIGVALELPYEFLIKHFEASYSASRAAIEMAYQFFLSIRQWFVDTFCQSVYEWVIEEAVAQGRLHAPGFFTDPIIRQAYCGAEWIGNARISLDPDKEAKANKKWIEMGVKTRAGVTSEITGGDFDANHKQSVKEHEMRKRDGLLMEEQPVSEETKEK